MRWAALLRAINAGVKLPMADLRSFLSEEGMDDVKTLLASGNAIFGCAEKDGDALAARLRAAAKARLGVDTEWFLRSGAELEAIVAANPFAQAARERPSQLHVHLFDAPVDPALIERVSEIHDGPEELAVIGRELFVDYAGGIGVSKLPQAMAKAKIPKAQTARNWNTILKLTAATAPA